MYAQAPAPSAPATFSYGYMNIRCEAVLDATELKVKQGIRNFTVPLATIRHLYVQAVLGNNLTMYVATEPTPGKRKIFRFMAIAGQPAFEALVNALVARLPPGGDLRALDDKTALKTMGARDLDVTIGLVFFALMMIGINVGLFPKLIHGVDGGSQKISCEDLGSGKSLDSRNVAITKVRALEGWALALTTVTKKNGIETGRSTKDYIPLVPKDWEKGDPIRVVLETKHNQSLDEIPYRGIARTVMWEGLGSSQREYFEKKGIKIAKDAVLVEFHADPSTDLWIFLGANGIMTAISGAIALVIWRKRKQKQKQQQAARPA